jgi:Tol biopolymer transport system component
MDIAIVEDPSGQTKPRKLKLPPDRYESPRLSPDGTVATDVEADQEAPARIYTIATNGGSQRQLLTWMTSNNRFPAWTHDGRRIAYQSPQHLGIWWMAADRSDQPWRLTLAEAGEEHIPESWSADGTLLYSITTSGTARLWTLPVRIGRVNTKSSNVSAIDPAAGKPLPFGTETSREPMNATFSPDSKAVAYTRTDKGETAVCVELFPSRGSTCLPTSVGEFPRHPRWSADGKRLFYVPRPGDFASVEVVLEPEVHFGKPEPIPYHPILLEAPGFRTPYDINKDGQLVGLIPMGQAEFRMTPPKAIVVVWNWFEVLKQKFR